LEGVLVGVLVGVLNGVFVKLYLGVKERVGVLVKLIVYTEESVDVADGLGEPV
jgi:hypothetical protein